MTVAKKPLSGLRVLVPRGGTWGEIVSHAIREQGAIPVISPLVDFASSSEEAKLVTALKGLEEGAFDWLTATTSTIVGVLAHHGVVIHPRTKLAVVGEATEAAFIKAGYEVARTPSDDKNTAEGLLETWSEVNTDEQLKILTLRSNVAKPVLTAGLIDRGHDVTQVVSFRTVGVPASVHTLEDVTSGHINALLVASPMIAHEIHEQFADRPSSTIIACVGDAAREEAAKIGLCDPDCATRPLVRDLVEAVEAVIEYSDTLD